VDDHAWRLVHHDQVRIVVNDWQRDRLRPRLEELHLRQLVLDEIAGSNSLRGTRPKAVEQNTPGPHQPSRGGAAELRIQLSQRPVKPGL